MFSTAHRSSSSAKLVPASPRVQSNGSAKIGHISGQHYLRFLDAAHSGYQLSQLSAEAEIVNGKFYVCKVDTGIQYALLNHDGAVVRDIISTADLKAANIQLDLNESKPVTELVSPVFESILAIASAKGHKNAKEVLWANKLIFYVRQANRPFDEKRLVLSKMTEDHKKDFENSMAQHVGLLTEIIEKQNIRFPIDISDLKISLSVIIPAVFGITTVFRMAIRHVIADSMLSQEAKSALDTFANGYVYHVLTEYNKKFSGVDDYGAMYRRFNLMLLSVYDLVTESDNDYASLFLSKVRLFYSNHGMLADPCRVKQMISMFGVHAAEIYFQSVQEAIKQSPDSQKDKLLIAMIQILASMAPYQDLYSQASKYLYDQLNRIWLDRLSELITDDKTTYSEKLEKLHYFKTVLSMYKCAEVDQFHASTASAAALPSVDTEYEKFSKKINGMLYHDVLVIYYTMTKKDKSHLSIYDLIYINRILREDAEERDEFNAKFYKLTTEYIKSIVPESLQPYDIFKTDDLFKVLNMLTGLGNGQEKQLTKNILFHLVQFALKYDFNSHPTSRVQAPLLSPDPDSPLDSPSSRGSSTRSSSRGSARTIVQLRKRLFRNKSQGELPNSTIASSSQSARGALLSSSNQSGRVLPTMLIAPTPPLSPSPRKSTAPASASASASVSASASASVSVSALASAQTPVGMPVLPFRSASFTLPVSQDISEKNSNSTQSAVNMNAVSSTATALAATNSLPASVVSVSPVKSATTPSLVLPIKSLSLEFLNNSSDTDVPVLVVTQADYICKMIEAAPGSESDIMTLLLPQRNRIPPKTLEDARLKDRFESHKLNSSKSAASRAVLLPASGSGGTSSMSGPKRSSSFMSTLLRRTSSLEKEKQSKEIADTEKEKKPVNRKK